MEIITDPELLQQFLKHPLIVNFFPKQCHSQLRLITYQTGEALCQQEEQLTSLSYVIKGKIKMVRKLFNGKDYILGITDSPNLIGDIELFTGQTIISSVIALETVWVVELPLQNPKQLLDDAPFLYKVGKGLATSLYQQNIQAATNIGYSVKERLATHILSVANQQVFQLELHLLADSFGTSYRHLMRTIKKLLEDQIIAKEKNTYRILKPTELEKLSIQQ